MAWLLVWKLKYDKNKLIEQQENLSDNVSSEVESEISKLNRQFAERFDKMSNREKNMMACGAQEHEYFTVWVDDNYHFMDKSYRYQIVDDYDTKDEAIAKCREIVESSIGTNHKKGKSAEELFSGWSMYGESPFIVSSFSISPEYKETIFSASEYAKEFCEKLSKKNIPAGAGKSNIINL
jgi:hypothetical protein